MPGGWPHCRSASKGVKQTNFRQHKVLSRCKNWHIVGIYRASNKGSVYCVQDCVCLPPCRSLEVKDSNTSICLQGEQHCCMGLLVAYLATSVASCLASHRKARLHGSLESNFFDNSLCSLHSSNCHLSSRGKACTSSTTRFSAEDS